MMPFIEKATELVGICQAAGLMLATAESCTGGMIAVSITDVAGSSAVLDRGFVTYSNEAKQEMLGVSVETLGVFGAVSRQTATEMALGALARSHAKLAISVTGIAGPGGGSAEKPVGLVYMALALDGEPTRHKVLQCGDVGRHAIRLATVDAALDMLLEAASEQ